MKDLVNKIIKLDIDEIDSFDFPLYELIGIEIMYNDIKFEFIAHFTENPNLLCFGSGLVQRDSTTNDGKLIKPPYFRRWSWYKFFDENFIAYADPMFYLDDELIIGWYVGDKDNWYLEIISKILVKILDNRKISNNNTLFFGNSGGGFSSVILGTLIKYSKVLVINSTFDIRDHDNLRNVKKLSEVLHSFFNDYSDEEIFNEIKHRLSNIELFKKLEYVPDITCYVNVNSETDVMNQYSVFADKLLKLPFFKNNFNVHFYHDDNGHHPPSNFKTIILIKNFSNEFLYNHYDQFYNVVAKSINYGEDLVVNLKFPYESNYPVDVKIGDLVKSVTLKKGVGSVNFTGLNVGSYEVIVSYDGEGSDNKMNSPVKLIANVNKATPTIQAIIFGNMDYLGISIKLPKDVSRRAIVTIDDISRYVRLKNGEGAVKFDGLKEGSYEVKIFYAGDENYEPASFTREITLTN